MHEQTFHESAPIYQNALRHSNFDHKLDYMKQAPQKTRRNRQRNIIWLTLHSAKTSKQTSHAFPVPRTVLLNTLNDRLDAIVASTGVPAVIEGTLSS